jgi:CHAT domain-containing protein
MPLHAAGMYPQGPILADKFVSSYTPSLSVLVPETPAVLQPFKVAVVAMPSTPGQSDLLSVVKEAEQVTKRMKHYSSTVESDYLKGSMATADGVIKMLRNCTCAHFACHATQDSSNPLRSALLLHDKPLQISQLMESKIEGARLAFLSACQTAMGHKETPGENIHLAGVFLFAGFRGVVGSLWSIEDVDGPEVANAFYHSLLSSGPPDTINAALALDNAVTHLRKAGVPFVRWVPFIYMGI